MRPMGDGPCEPRPPGLLVAPGDAAGGANNESVLAEGLILITSWSDSGRIEVSAALRPAAPLIGAADVAAGAGEGCSHDSDDDRPLELAGAVNCGGCASDRRPRLSNSADMEELLLLEGATGAAVTAAGAGAGWLAVAAGTWVLASPTDDKLADDSGSDDRDKPWLLAIVLGEDEAGRAARVIG